MVYTPSSGSNFALVSAVISPAMKRWLAANAKAVCDVDSGPYVVGVDDDDDDDEDDDDDSDVFIDDDEQGSLACGLEASSCGSAVVTDGTLSRRTWAMLRGWRSFCTAWVTNKRTDRQTNTQVIMVMMIMINMMTIKMKIMLIWIKIIIMIIWIK